MIKGAITALVTPFTSDGVDEKAFRSFVDWQIDQGIDGIVPCGTTGESPTLTHDEHFRVIEMAVEAANRRVPVMAGTGSNETRIAIRYTEYAKKVGADAALIVTPYYNKPNARGIYAHFKAIHDAVDIPIYVYNIPGRSVIDVDNETMARLAELPNIVGCKDATGDITRVTELRDLCGEDFIQLSGDDATALGHTAHGGHGVISVGSNIAPKAYADMVRMCRDGDIIQARKIHENLDRIHKDLFLDPSPAPTKYALSLMGKMDATVRLPITPCSAQTEEKVRIAMDRAGISY